MEKVKPETIAMVDAVVLEEALSTICRSSFFTASAMPALVELVKQIDQGARDEGKLGANTLVKNIVDSFKGSNPSLAKAIDEAIPRRPTKKATLIRSLEGTLTGR